MTAGTVPALRDRVALAIRKGALTGSPAEATADLILKMLEEERAAARWGGVRRNLALAVYGIESGIAATAAGAWVSQGVVSLGRERRMPGVKLHAEFPLGETH